MGGQQAQMEELQARIRWLEGERERVSWLLEAVSVGFVVMDEHGNVKEFNAQLERMLGFKRGVIGRGPLARLIMQPDIPVFLDHLRRCKFSQMVTTSELRMRNGKKGGLPVELISLPSQNDAEPALYRTAIIDLSKRRASEQKLSDTLESFGTLLDTVEGIVWEVDGESLQVSFVSRYAEKMLGYPLSQWFQEGFWERHIYVDDRERVMQEISRALRERINITIDYRVLTADRRWVWIHDRIGVRLHGGKVNLLGIAVDMTAQKNIEEELDDMRAPLRAMEGYTQLLRNVLADKLGPKELDYFGRIMASAERLDNLIQDVLQYSRVARAPLELKEIDLEKLVAQVISDYPSLQPPGADIQIQKPLLRVLGHEAFLTQCISNLLSNAVKFVAPGVKPKVSVYTKAVGTEIRLFVEDNGIGIAAENQRQIFGIFQRLHPNTTYPGTGIGLAIVQKAVQRMGGRVGVDSALGKGSSFWLQLKRAG